MNDIFENQTEVIENIRESAKELGAEVGEIEKEKVFVVKKNCKICWGKGWVAYSFPGNKGDKEVSNFYCKCVKFK